MLYLPHLPEGFVDADGVPQWGDFAEAVYFSIGNLSTVGYGEIVAGPALLLFPALKRRRALANHLNLVREAGHGRA